METSLQAPISRYFTSDRDAATLAFFRIGFGLLMFVSLVRFWALGWIDKLYLTPKFHFHYQWMEWVTVPGVWTYGLFVLCGLAALMVAAGYRYRVSIIVFFLSFTYIEMMDKTTYLNHYYLISLLSFMLIWLPAHCLYSIDAHKDHALRAGRVQSWTVDSLRVMIAIVYIAAGLAKINPDWMTRAMPLALWLQGKTHLPIIGSLMHHTWLHYAMSWGGALYDLCIIPLLLFRRTRVLGFVAVVVFHLMTRLLFPIGMFPFIMIFCSLLFFTPVVHRRILDWLWERVGRLLGMSDDFAVAKWQTSNPLPKSAFLGLSRVVIVGFLIVQLAFPLRSHILTDNVYWTERGYRYSWRVMLMEKTGYANFKVTNTQTGKRFYVDNSDFLTSFQQKQMAIQPDFILEYGKYLGRHFEGQGHEHVGVFVESYVALNGRPSQQYLDPNVDLMQTDYQSLVESHILPFDE